MNLPARILAAFCISVAFGGLAEANCFKHEFKQVSKKCNYGCFYYGYSNGHDGCRSLAFRGHRFRAFYLANEGPSALSVMAVSPEWYTGWGCDLSVWGKTCNRIGKLESGQTIFMEMIYGDYADGARYDFRFVDEQGVEVKYYDVALGTNSIPTITYYSSSRNRAPSMRIDYP